MNYTRSGSLTTRVKKLMNQFPPPLFACGAYGREEKPKQGLGGCVERKRPLEELRAGGSKYDSSFQINMVDSHALGSCYSEWGKFRDFVSKIMKH